MTRVCTLCGRVGHHTAANCPMRVARSFDRAQPVIAALGIVTGLMLISGWMPG